MALSSGGDRLAREIDEYALRLYKTDPRDSNHPRLPRCWSSKDRSRTLKLSHFALAVTYGGGYSERHDPTYNNHEPATVRADVPIPLTTGIYYFEVTVSNKGNNGRSVSVGVVTKSSNLTKLPGCEHSSFGYHNDGSVYHGSSSSGLKFGPRIVENDTVGCGIDFMSRSLFFTRNGIFLGKAFEGKIPVSHNRLFCASSPLPCHSGFLSRSCRCPPPFHFVLLKSLYLARVLLLNIHINDPMNIIAADFRPITISF
ncbi:uncharacterized protein DEA37_0014248, partial [Paragonimus westermani]